MSYQTILPKADAASNEKPTIQQKLKDIQISNWSKYAEISAAFGAGILSYNLFFGMKNDGSPNLPEKEAATEASNTTSNTTNAVETHISHNAEVAHSVTDDMSFGEAFQASRTELGAGNFFWWRGRLYNNFTENEFKALSEADKTALLDDIKEAIAEQPPLTTTNAFDYDSNSSETSISNHSSSNNNNSHFMVEATTDKLEYLDKDSDGQIDGAIVNMDDDPQAEIVYDWTSGTPYAFVDSNNTGVIDMVYDVDETGQLSNPTELLDTIEAPRMTTRQYIDFIRKDGVIDSLVFDKNSDGIGETVISDKNQDGVFDIAFMDTTGDGMLDMMCSVVNDQLGNPMKMNTPISAPIVEMYALTEQEEDDIPYEKSAFKEDSFGDPSFHQKESSGGLDNDLDEEMDDWD